jgi:hypothetical protein
MAACMTITSGGFAPRRKEKAERAWNSVGMGKQPMLDGGWKMVDGRCFAPSIGCSSLRKEGPRNTRKTGRFWDQDGWDGWDEFWNNEKIERNEKEQPMLDGGC